MPQENTLQRKSSHQNAGKPATQDISGYLACHAEGRLAYILLLLLYFFHHHHIILFLFLSIA